MNNMESFVIVTKQETEQNQNANDGIDTSYADAEIDAKVKEMDLLFSITTCGPCSIGFYLHKTTKEPYIVVSDFLSTRYFWITKVTTSDMDASSQTKWN